MSYRMSPDDALARGLISDATYREMVQAAGAAKRQSSGRGRGGRTQASSGDSPPQKLLYEAIDARWPGRFAWELRVKPPGAKRAYSLDIASTADRLCIEMDGWQHHGKFKQDFQRDRIRQNRLCLDGWRILRFYPGQVYGELEDILSLIGIALA